MRKLITWILVKLGLREPPVTVGWKWYGGYGDTISDDWIILKWQ